MKNYWKTCEIHYNHVLTISAINSIENGNNFANFNTN